MLEELRTIEGKVLAIGRQIQFENRVCGRELEERLRLGLTGDAAIKHYNEWMKRYGLHHLVAK